MNYDPTDAGGKRASRTTHRITRAARVARSRAQCTALTLEGVERGTGGDATGATTHE